MTSRDPIDEILALVDKLVDNPPAPEGDILPEYALVFKEGFLEGVSRSLKVIVKYEYEKQNKIEQQDDPAQPDAEQVTEFIERSGLPFSAWQIRYLTRQLQKRSDGQVY